MRTWTLPQHSIRKVVQSAPQAKLFRQSLDKRVYNFGQTLYGAYKCLILKGEKQIAYSTGTWMLNATLNK